MVMSPFKIGLPSCIAILALTNFAICYAQSATAPVSGFANEFPGGIAMADAKITVLETGQTFTTNRLGKFGPFDYPVGKSMTLQLEKWGYITTQTDTMMVPPHGLTEPYNNPTFQVPNWITFQLLAKVIGATVDENACHLVTTITAYHKTMDDLPQGEAGAKLTIAPAVGTEPFYFDVFTDGPFKDRTNPFTQNLGHTSEDGGALIFNLPPSDVPYHISAQKDGVRFTETQFLCRKGAFINISPPRGPMALNSQ